MKGQKRITLALVGLAAAAALYPCIAAAQIAQPVATTVDGVRAEVPFELFRENRIMLNGRIAGNDTPMILDSGAGVTVIDRDYAKDDRPQEGPGDHRRRAWAAGRMPSSSRT